VLGAETNPQHGCYDTPNAQTEQRPARQSQTVESQVRSTFGPTCLLGPTTTSMLRNLQQQFPIGVQPIVKIWRLRRLVGTSRVRELERRVRELELCQHRVTKPP
jgi:hypothetical protein